MIYSKDMGFNTGRKSSILLILIVLFIIPPSAAFSYELEGVHLAMGNALSLNAESIDVSPAPSPVSAPCSGVSVPMTFMDALYFEPGMYFYNTTVILTDEYRVVPATLETADRISVLNIELRPELGVDFDISDKITLGVTGAPAFILRFPIIAYDDAEENDYKSIVREYYFSKGRFLSLYAGGFFNWSFSENADFRIKAGTNVPIYHLWDEEDTEFYDELIIEPTIGLTFKF